MRRERYKARKEIVMADEAKAAEELQLVVFSLGREEFAVEVTQVREIMRMEEITRMPKSPPFVEGIINLRGQIIAVVDLANEDNRSRSGESKSWHDR
jgi:purine-binding chemotaxis protein CheW